MPEVSRVVLMPEPARDELGYWKDKKGTGRLRGLSNRYSREGEEVLLLANQTPFYGESGGQVGDTGTIRTVDGGSTLV